MLLQCDLEGEVAIAQLAIRTCDLRASLGAGRVGRGCSIRELARLSVFLRAQHMLFQRHRAAERTATRSAINFGERVVFRLDVLLHCADGLERPGADVAAEHGVL